MWLVYQIVGLVSRECGEMQGIERIHRGDGRDRGEDGRDREDPDGRNRGEDREIERILSNLLFLFES